MFLKVAGPASKGGCGGLISRLWGWSWLQDCFVNFRLAPNTGTTYHFPQADLVGTYVSKHFNDQFIPKIGLASWRS